MAHSVNSGYDFELGLGPRPGRDPASVDTLVRGELSGEEFAEIRKVLREKYNTKVIVNSPIAKESGPFFSPSRTVSGPTANAAEIKYHVEMGRYDMDVGDGMHQIHLPYGLSDGGGYSLKGVVYEEVQHAIDYVNNPAGQRLLLNSRNRFWNNRLHAGTFRAMAENKHGLFKLTPIEKFQLRKFADLQSLQATGARVFNQWGR